MGYFKDKKEIRELELDSLRKINSIINDINVIVSSIKNVTDEKDINELINVLSLISDNIDINNI